MDTDDAAAQKKYWNDQIKGNVGPCMITFSIPLTIPGLTITLVAFSEDTTFQVYGTLHIVGILFLAFAIILIILGCILRVLWKPIIGPDIEMHLSPNPSMVNVRTRQEGTEINRTQEIYRGQTENSHRVSPAPIRNSNRESHRSTPPLDVLVRNEFPKSDFKREKRFDNAVRRPSTDRTASDHNSSYEGTGSETESTTILSRTRKNQSNFRSPRGSRHLMEMNSPDKQNMSSQDQLSKARLKTLQDELALEDIHQWRSSKRKKRKPKEKTDKGLVNTVSNCEENQIMNTNMSIPTVTVDEPPHNDTPSLSSETKLKQDAGNSTGEDYLSGPSAKSPRQSLLPNSGEDDRKRKKKRKKKKVLASLKQDSVDSNTAKDERVEPSSSFELPKIEGIEKDSLTRENSSDSLGSIGSADSVLAQYTSRTGSV